MELDIEESNAINCHRNSLEEEKNKDPEGYKEYCEIKRKLEE